MDELCFFFSELQRDGFMKEVNGARVFLNYKDLYSCNLYFWNRSILPVLNQCRYVHVAHATHAFADNTEGCWTRG